MLTGPLVEVNVGAVPSPSGAGALVLHNEESADCLVVLMVWTSQGTRRAALATFVGCTQPRFGYPNDEAYWAVEGAGYGFYEVVQSEWADEITAFNRRRFPEATAPRQERHFFMGCHDASGQFLAQDLRLEVFEEDYASVVARALERVVPDPSE